MDILQGQTGYASQARELRGRIPRQLHGYIDIRPTANSLTAVSLLDCAPMRGVTGLTEAEAAELLDQLKPVARFLVSSNKTDAEKRRQLAELGFPGRQGAPTPEEQVQAYYIRDLIANGPESRTLADYLGWPGLDYLAAELAWSADGAVDRPDLLCACAGAPHRLLIIEFKAGRETKFEQSRYAEVIRKHEPAVREFVAALTGAPVTDAPLEVKIIFLMPWHRGNSTLDWEALAREAACDGVVFYERGFPVVSIAGDAPDGGLLPADHRACNLARELARTDRDLTVSRLQRDLRLAHPVAIRVFARLRREGVL